MNIVKEFHLLKIYIVFKRKKLFILSNILNFIIMKKLLLSQLEEASRSRKSIYK